MDEAKTGRLHKLLRRLGQAVHGSVVRSDEVRECLQELHENGWRAVMLVETSVACDESGAIEQSPGTLRLHVDEGEERDSIEYRIGVEDARLLASLGISPGRHRAVGGRLLRAPAEKEADGDL